jgi:type I restriction enzyme S subunit
VRKGDLIFTPSSETAEEIGLSALVDEELPETVYSYHVIRLRFTKPIAHRFKKYLCNNSFVLNQFSKRAKGTTRQILGREDFKNIEVFVPSENEQEQISFFLDKRTKQIDELIAQKERMIDLLKERWIAIIDNAIVAGLDVTAKMKKSGIDHIDLMPSNWSLKKLKYLGRFQNGISEGAEYFGSGFPFVSYGDVYNNITLPYDVEGLAQSSVEERQKMSVEEGDVFFTRTSETIEEIGISSVCMKNLENAIFSGFLIRFRPKPNILLKDFSKYYFRSSLTRRFFVREMNIVTRASLAQDLLKELPVLLPPVPEQESISEYLDKKCGQIDNQINREKRSIELLKEYRTALISEVVTGKIDVRENA